MFLEQKISIRMISEGYETEDWSIMMHLAFTTGINYILKYIK